jgi:hypothetical protein
MKKVNSLLLFVTMFLVAQTINAQVDFNAVRANPKTFMFSDGQSTVQNAIYAELQEYTTCCGNDAIYVEVKFDEAGNYVSAKTLTGRNDCYKNSIIDIVKKIKWDVSAANGSRTIYFELKPVIPCTGSPAENTYKPVE